MSTTTGRRTTIVCDSCETAYVVDATDADPATGFDPAAALPRCEDCGATAFRTLDTDGGGRSRSAP